MSGPDYLDFRDSVIVARADETKPGEPHAIEIADLCERHSISFEETWLRFCGPDIAEAGFGRVYNGKRSWKLALNVNGLARAAEIRRERKPQSALAKIHKLNWTTWGGVAACLGVSIAVISIAIAVWLDYN